MEVLSQRMDGIKQYWARIARCDTDGKLGAVHILPHHIDLGFLEGAPPPQGCRKFEIGWSLNKIGCQCAFQKFIKKAL